MYSALFSSHPALGEETAPVLARFEAAAATLLAREFRAPALLQMARVYRLYEMEDAAVRAEARSAACAAKWSTQASRAVMSLLQE